MLNTQNGKSAKDAEFDKAFYFGSRFIQFSTYLDFKDSLLYGMKAFNESRESPVMNPEGTGRKSFVLWDGENEQAFIRVKSKWSGECFGIFLLTSNPAEVVTDPENDRLIFRIMGDGIFSMYFYAGPTMEEVIQQHSQTLGRIAMPPYKALGLQYNFYGANLAEVKQEI